TRGPIQATQHVHQRRFSRSTGAHYRDKFARLDFERHTAHGMHVHFAGVVDFVNLLEFDDRLHQNLLKPPPPNGFEGRLPPWLPGPEDCIVSKPITTWSPSFKPSTTSVLTPSVIPVRILTGLSSVL